MRRELLALSSEDGAPLTAALYHQEEGIGRTGLILMHPVVDFLHHYALIPLALRGFACLGLNSRFAGNEALATMEQAALDLAAGVRHLRDIGLKSVILVGNSGGGSLATFYQAEAECPTVTGTPDGGAPDLTRCNLPPADAVIALNAHPGRAQVLTAWLDPAVVDETEPLAINPELDMFDPANGPPYSMEFVDRYRAAQVERNGRITSWARSRLDLLRPAGAGDQGFTVHRTVADPRMLDLGLDPSDRAAGCYWGPDVRGANLLGSALGRFATIRSWLSMWGLETTQAGGAATVARIGVPLLFIQGTADQGIYPSDARAFHDAASTGDRELHWVPGGSHYFLGQPDLQRQAYDLIENWLQAHGHPGG